MLGQGGGLAFAKARVEDVSQGISEDVEAEDRGTDEEAGVDRELGADTHILAALDGEHLAPGRLTGRAEPKEAEAGFGEDDTAETDGGVDQAARCSYKGCKPGEARE